MVDFNAFLQRKYDILQQNANSEATRSAAQANLSNTQASVIPNESRMRVAGMDAQNDLTRQQVRYYGDEARARMGLAGAQTNLYGVQAAQLPLDAAARRDALGVETEGRRITNRFMPEDIQSTIAQRGAQTEESRARAGELRAGTEFLGSEGARRALAVGAAWRGGMSKSDMMRAGLLPGDDPGTDRYGYRRNPILDMYPALGRGLDDPYSRE